ncbi:hypothetical protein KQ873_03365 [Mycoplasma zalophidermidis]|uniref:hypothetical protein n=1 Tax=Mycoplasma zalophidermidis TaxID=398174 RepID=UPI001C0FF3FA|nr:hypothetical protein [Mycoplasma zalophidermidis]MBU4690061.1 hypothetical protein [Mycoplasma zalophidermidis]
MKIKKFRLALLLGSPFILTPAISASCLDRVNEILNKNRLGVPEKKNPDVKTSEPSQKDEPAPEKLSEPNKNGDTSPKRTQLEIINDFTDIYKNKTMLDLAPAIFNEPGIIIARFQPKPFAQALDVWTKMFKHATTQLRYSGNKRFYDYVLQADNFKENLRNRLLRLDDVSSGSFYSNNYRTTRLGEEWRDYITYDLNKFIELYTDFYEQRTAESGLWFGIVPVDMDEEETEIVDNYSAAAKKANWWIAKGNIEAEADDQQPRIPYSDMFLVSKNFYERADRHFLQERVLLDKTTNKRLALDPIPNKSAKDSDYFNAWYNFKFPFDAKKNTNITRDYIGAFPPTAQFFSENGWTPNEMYNNEFIQAPFKDIQNSHINANQLKLLKSFLHFKTILTLLRRDRSTPFLKLLDDKKNEELQKFYQDNGYADFTAFKMDLYNKFYEPVFGKIEKLEANTNEAKTNLAKTKIKNFMEHNFIKERDNTDKNLLFIYDIQAKDITGINFNDFWFNPNSES